MTKSDPYTELFNAMAKTPVIPTDLTMRNGDIGRIVPGTPEIAAESLGQRFAPACGEVGHQPTAYPTRYVGLHVSRHCRYGNVGQAGLYHGYAVYINEADAIEREEAPIFIIAADATSAADIVTEWDVIQVVPTSIKVAVEL